MPLDLSSAVFTSPPIVLFETAGRRGIATAFEDIPAMPPLRSRIEPKGHFESRVTVIEIGEPDPVGAAIQRNVKLSKKQLETKAQIEDRLRDLYIDALRNAEPFSESSLLDLRSFLYSLPLAERPSIFLLDSGNLRAVWRNAEKEQVGLQFLGSGVVQFVMFARREHPKMMSRSAGTDTLAGIRVRINNKDCDRLLFGNDDRALAAA
jgi:hypothetical protein